MIDHQAQTGKPQPLPRGLSETAPLRIGVALSELALTPWQRPILQRIIADPGLKLEVIVEVPPDTERGEGGIGSFVDGWERLLSRRLFGGALRRKGLAPAGLEGRDVPVGSLSGTEHVSVVAGGAAPGLDAYSIDVLLVLDPLAISGGRVGGACRRVWHLATTEGLADRSSPLGFWELYRNEPVTDVHLLAASSEEDGVVATGGYGTFRWSWSLNAVLLGERAAWLVTDALSRLRRGLAHEPHAARRPARRAPSAWHRLLALAKCHARILGEGLRRALFDESWRILAVEGSRHGPSRTPPVVIDPTPDSYWADPFVARRGNTAYIFFEQYLYRDGRGIISYLELPEGERRGRLQLRPRKLLDDGFHLSYPFLFRHEGSLYMIPESSAVRRIDLWRCVELPHAWEKAKCLMEGVSAADSSLLQWEGKWWMFTNIDRAGIGDHRSELHIFYADDPVRGAWTAHPLNPVVVDARRARMAGGFLEADDGRPVRCCQVQGRRYGEQVAYYRIEQLSETRYVERAIDWPNQVVSDKGARHHHVFASDGMIVADECVETPKLRRIFGARTRPASTEEPGRRDV